MIRECLLVAMVMVVACSAEDPARPAGWSEATHGRGAGYMYAEAR